MQSKIQGHTKTFIYHDRQGYGILSHQVNEAADSHNHTMKEKQKNLYGFFMQQRYGNAHTLVL